MEIPKKYNRMLPKYSEKLGLSVEELEDLLIGKFQAVDSNNPDASNTIKWTKAYNMFRGELRRRDNSLKSPAPMFTGLVWSDSGVLDFIELQKRKAISMFKNPEKRQYAIDNRIVDRDGTPLDQREKINYGKEENPNYLQPYPKDEHSYYRALCGVASKGGEFGDDLQFFRLNINGPEALDVTYPYNVPVHFRGNIKTGSNFGFYDLNSISDKVDVFNVANLSPPDDIYEKLQTQPWRPYTLDELESVHSLYGNERVQILVEANVGDISEEINDKTGNRTIWLDDPMLSFDESGVVCFMNGELPINFGLDSRILIVSRLNKMGSGDDERIVIEGQGYYAIPAFLIPPE